MKMNICTSRKKWVQALPVIVGLALVLVATPLRGPALAGEDAASRNQAAHAQASKFLQAIQSILDQAAAHRKDARKLPSENDYMIIAPPWTETREDRQDNIKILLDAPAGFPCGSHRVFFR